MNCNKLNSGKTVGDCRILVSRDIIVWRACGTSWVGVGMSSIVGLHVILDLQI